MTKPADSAVKRVRSELDRHQTNVVVTPLGHSTIENAPDALQQRSVQALAKLAGWEQA